MTHLLHVPAQSGPASCSAESFAAHEPLPGTAPYARAVLVVEQPGPWGRDALLESHLDADIATELNRRAADLPIKIFLARQPGRHADDHATPIQRRVWAALVDPEAPRSTSWTTTDPTTLLDIDLDALVAGVLPHFGADDSHDATIFVCGNAKRDLCCAREGRALAASLSADPLLTDRVWEISHLGGHRFAPTALVLPQGVIYGRLDVESARDALVAADRNELTIDHQRGQMGLLPAAQAADIRVRRETGLRRRDAVRVIEVLEGAHGGDLDGWFVTARTSDGDRWSIAVTAERGVERRESCAKDAAPMTYYQASIVARTAIA